MRRFGRGRCGEGRRVADLEPRLNLAAGGFGELLGPIFLRDGTDFALQGKLAVGQADLHAGAQGLVRGEKKLDGFARSPRLHAGRGSRHGGGFRRGFVSSWTSDALDLQREDLGHGHQRAVGHRAGKDWRSAG